MFKHIVVPLDGSALAEQALAPATRIAEKFGGDLLLLRVIGAEHTVAGLAYLAGRPETAASPSAWPLYDEADAYLSTLRLTTASVPVRTRVLSGAAPEMIIATSAECGADLIVMSTHGRAGLMRLLYGSVAEAVLRGATVPVLLVPSRAYARQADEARGEPRRVAMPASRV